MKRGISFRIPNEYGSFLGEVLKPFDTTAYNWRVRGEKSYFVDRGMLGEQLFPEEINGLDGVQLKGILEDNKYYLIFADLKAYAKGMNVVDIKMYENFLDSDCQLVLLVIDSIYIAIYCKDKVELESLYHNANTRGFADVQYTTDDNDYRTRLSVW